jgi:hypothetical protein
VSKKEPQITKKKVASKKKVAKKQVAKKQASSKKTNPSGTSALISPRERYKMIATMAYYRAEQRNFDPGHDVEDWLDCERIIDQMLAK